LHGHLNIQESMEILWCDKS